MQRVPGKLFLSTGKPAGKLVALLGDFPVCCHSLENVSLLKLNALYAALCGDTSPRSSV